jgi:hypothetical protein
MFVLSSTEMPGVSSEVAEHTVNIKLGSRSIKHGLQRFNQEKCWAMIKEVLHPDWIANPILVPKRTGNGGCSLITQA